MTRRALGYALVAALAIAPLTAHAGILSDPSSAGFAPRVPLSAFGLPTNWIDFSRLHLSSTVSVGSGWGGGQTNALQVTSLSYQFHSPLTMSISLGNTFGLNRPQGSSGSPFFLEGLDVAWRPNGNTLFRVAMHDVRSPLQYGWGRYSGADPLFAPY
jgi:hypothetical protein